MHTVGHGEAPQEVGRESARHPGVPPEANVQSGGAARISISPHLHPGRPRGWRDRDFGAISAKGPSHAAGEADQCDASSEELHHPHHRNRGVVTSTQHHTHSDTLISGCESSSPSPCSSLPADLDTLAAAQLLSTKP